MIISADPEARLVSPVIVRVLRAPVPDAATVATNVILVTPPETHDNDDFVES